MKCGTNETLIYRDMTIDFATDRVELPALDRTKIADWLERIATMMGKRIGTVAYIFCDDERILEVNKEFLCHDYYTDVITFDYSRYNRVSGDIYISLDTVASNAAQLGKSGDEELLRVIAHGLLHLCGINDKGPGEREIMVSYENKALAMLK